MRCNVPLNTFGVLSGMTTDLRTIAGSAGLWALYRAAKDQYSRDWLPNVFQAWR